MTFSELLANIRRATMLDIIQTHEDMPDLLNRAAELFEQYHLSTQIATMACMLGMALATVEGETCEGEGELGVIITHKERLDVFLAQFTVVFNEAMAARASGDAPQQGTRDTVN